AEQQVDFVDGDELGIDVRHVRRRALVVVDDELDRAAEQPALGVDVVAPDLERGVDHLARCGARAGEREAHADPDRIAALRERPRNETKSDDQRGAKGTQKGPQRVAAHVHDRFLPLLRRRIARRSEPRCDDPYRRRLLSSWIMVTPYPFSKSYHRASV